ncbi:hypothetical protein [Flavobacterium sp.]|jgi:hypothetical protein|uniref:hypothetical protein n=1 Tax=Flavobacterium sp. TaxID=239 RepID=UPI002A7FF712|nr:hypothetical protein [Flavobacterium sp.]
MKNYIFLILSLVLLTSCEKETTSNLKQIEANLKTDNSSTSEFILKNDTILKGKLGTEIFIPKDLFDNYTNGKITFELKEFYSKEDIILNGLSTITDKDELLESSGMLYINFTENGKQLIIAEGKKYRAQLPNKILDKSNIYTNDNDSIFKWKSSNNKIYTEIPDYPRNLKFLIYTKAEGIGGFFKEVHLDSVDIVKRKDSLDFVKIQDKYNQDVIEQNEVFLNELGWDSEINNGKLSNDEKTKKRKKLNNLYSIENEVYSFSSDTLGWINIDKLLEYEIEKNIQFKNKVNHDFYCVNLVYLNNNSILAYYPNEFKILNQKVKIKGEMKIIIYSYHNDKLFYDTFYLDKNSKTNFEINLKETTLEKLKTILITP